MFIILESRNQNNNIFIYLESEVESMTNLKIRQAIVKNRLKYYEVAAACGISSCTFSVWLREEFSPEREQLVMKAIKNLAEKEA